MKAIELHNNKVKQQIKKLTDCNYEIGNKNVLLRSDSKGRAFLPFLNYRNKINLIYRSGASITNPFMKNTLIKVNKTANPIVVLFFGTCELTNKQGKYILVPENLDAKLDEIKRNYLLCKRDIIQANPSAKVIFLDCPYQSIIIWNFLKGHPCPGSFENDQKRLESAITILNTIIRDINGNQIVPRLALDITYSTKKKGKAPKYYRNYSLLRDGVHPTDQLTRLWFLRIRRMIALA